MAISKPTGPPPVAKRRRANKPASYGLAEAETAGTAAPQPRLGFTAHKLVKDLWSAMGVSVEGAYYSHADWARARLELMNLNDHLNYRAETGKPVSSMAWAAIQHGLNELLISAADKRRAGIELKKIAVDPDEEAAVSQMAVYRDKLTG